MITIRVKNMNVKLMYIDCSQADAPVRVSFFFYHAGLAQSILHHQHVLQAHRGTRLQLLIGDL